MADSGAAVTSAPAVTSGAAVTSGSAVTSAPADSGTAVRNSDPATGNGMGAVSQASGQQVTDRAPSEAGQASQGEGGQRAADQRGGDDRGGLHFLDPGYGVYAENATTALQPLFFGSAGSVNLNYGTFKAA